MELDGDGAYILFLQERTGLLQMVQALCPTRTAIHRVLRERQRRALPDARRREYRESVKIVRQYQVLLSSLPMEQQRFLEEYLMDNRDYPIFKPPYNRYTHIIYENWEQICFPQNISSVKTIDRVQLGKTIRMMRENQGLSRRQVAELLQINDKTLSAYENGERLVKADVLFGMSQIYKTSIDLIIEKSMPVFL